ncbi:MAG: GNAT family N-acetyltransferase [Anaerolineales bacterium]
MDLNQLIIRSFSPAQDITRLLSLYNTINAIDQDGVEINEQSLRSQLDLPGYDPLKDRWVIDDPDDPASLIASALIRHAPRSNITDANIIVHPSWRRQGIGSMLLSRIIERAQQLESPAIQIYANPKHPTSPCFLQKHGFIIQGAYTELQLTADTRLPPVIWPFGYTMRPYSEVQNISTLTEAMNLSYIPLWGHHEVSEAEMASWLLDFNQQGLFLVFSEKGRVVGITRVEPSPERTLKNGMPTGYIDAPGVVPQHRRLDLYRALVLIGIRWLRDQGQSIIEMESWGDKLEVLNMYRELGFKDLRQRVCYQILLSRGDQRG